MKYKDESGQWKDLVLPATGDTLPVGAVVEFEGDTVPSNWTKVEEIKPNDYTTEEQVIGTWMGKPLYRKVFTGNISKDTVLISNVDVLIDVKGTGSVSGLYRVIPFYQIYNDKEYTLTIEKKDTHEVVLIVNEKGNSSVSYDSNITLEYTKTTD